MAREYWTDYPFEELGDTPGREAPIRRCEPLSYDGNKYVSALVAGGKFEFKAGYIYTEEGRCGEAPTISRGDLAELPETEWGE